MAIKRVSKWHLRRLFNSSGYWQQTQTGNLTAAVRKSSPAKREDNQPSATKSQIISYLDAGNSEVARVHQYLLADGITLGGHGYPDPLELVIDGTKYAGWIPPKHWMGQKALVLLQWVIGIH